MYTAVAVMLTIAGCPCDTPTKKPPNVREFLLVKATASVTVPVACADGTRAACESANLACKVVIGCNADRQCEFGRDPACSCYESEVRWCSGTSSVQFCTETAPGAGKTEWNKTCGPPTFDCDTGIPACPGVKRARFDLDGAAWVDDPSGSCEPTSACPTEGKVEACAVADPRCTSTRTYSLSTGWSPCNTTCPPPPVTTCTPGGSGACQTGEGCGGTRYCNGSGEWDGCTGPARCPAGWGWEGNQCVWRSPYQGTFVKYYPHRADNEKVAAVTPIGIPSPGGAQAPIYVEIVLDQWSNPPAGDGGNHCGKGDSNTAWVGCVHSGGGLGWGRDVADHEWADKVMIPLRCDPGDTVGIFKHSWGHDANWHCTRQLSLIAVINHDPINSCAW